MPKRITLDAATARNLFLERACAYYNELNRILETAPLGKGFDQAEAFAVAQGRELIRQSLETTFQQQIDRIEKKTKRDTVRRVRRKKDTSATKRNNG